MRLLLSLIVSFAMLWASAVLWFVITMPTEPLPSTTKTEAIVVLTGGKGRVEHGLTMLAEGAAPVLFISGVGEHVTEATILDAHATQETREKIYETNGEIVLDHIARSTVSNADQTAVFIRERGIKTIRLVTASYHMRRSMYEFRGANPGLKIVADPVFPEGFRRDVWWEHENTRRLIFSEFNKYIAILLRDLVRP